MDENTDSMAPAEELKHMRELYGMKRVLRAFWNPSALAATLGDWGPQAGSVSDFPYSQGVRPRTGE